MAPINQHRRPSALWASAVWRGQLTFLGLFSLFLYQCPEKGWIPMYAFVMFEWKLKADTLKRFKSGPLYWIHNTSGWQYMGSSHLWLTSLIWGNNQQVKVFTCKAWALSLFSKSLHISLKFTECTFTGAFHQHLAPPPQRAAYQMGNSTWEDVKKV